MKNIKKFKNLKINEKFFKILHFRKSKSNRITNLMKRKDVFALKEVE